ncbi:collagen alpha-1(I) chain-like [Neopelma chrysocephalum]|uniref:collagen alpha-1(I) chain-like n=1 Tax=Neopelma chrysocephalum TaxID=114329 RepID=UPI000FCCF250|nr:collagen alpha-1(I) chain-like [Neopelma chrysocephalum]
MDSGIEHPLSKFSDDTKPCGAIDTSEGWDAFHLDLDELKKWTHGNLMRFNKNKCRELHLGISLTSAPTSPGSTTRRSPVSCGGPGDAGSALPGYLGRARSGGGAGGARALPPLRERVTARGRRTGPRLAGQEPGRTPPVGPRGSRSAGGAHDARARRRQRQRQGGLCLSGTDCPHGGAPAGSGPPPPGTATPGTTRDTRDTLGHPGHSADSAGRAGPAPPLPAGGAGRGGAGTGAALVVPRRGGGVRIRWRPRRRQGRRSAGGGSAPARPAQPIPPPRPGSWGMQGEIDPGPSLVPRWSLVLGARSCSFLPGPVSLVPALCVPVACSGLCRD